MGKPSRIVSRSPRWKSRPHSKRRARVVRTVRKPLPLLDAGIAGATVLIVAVFVFFFAFVMWSRLQISLFVGFPAIAAGLAFGVLLSGRRLIHRRAMAAGLFALGVSGAVLFYVSREDFAYRSHQPSPQVHGGDSRLR